MGPDMQLVSSSTKESGEESFPSASTSASSTSITPNPVKVSSRGSRPTRSRGGKPRRQAPGSSSRGNRLSPDPSTSSGAVASNRNSFLPSLTNLLLKLINELEN